jgi:hypothetical protein
MALSIDSQPAERHPTIVYHFSGLGITGFYLEKIEKVSLAKH